MPIDGDRLIARHLAAKVRKEITFDDGRSTVLTPVPVVTQLADETARLPLDGDWSVARWPFRKSEEELAAPKTDSRDWERLPQPGPVFFYDPDTTSDDYENWSRVTLSHVHDDDGAVIRRTVQLPRTWNGMRVYLCFDAIFPAARIYLDGELLGEHLSGLTPVEYDVTDKVRPGTRAVVAVRLLRKHRFVQLDMVRHAIEFTGLAQPACFHATGQVQLRDYHLASDLDKALTTGKVKGTVRVRNHTSRAVTRTVTVTVADAEGKKVATCSRKVSVAPGKTSRAPLTLTVKSPQLWNDEFPNRYRVAIRLSGSPAQEASYFTGFRRLELSRKGARLNGNPVKFRGVNHLTFHPDGGMYTPEAWLRKNLQLMKKANVNTIRTHFLGPRCLAELCSELGIYLLQELPIDWGTHFIHDPEWMGPILMRLQGGVERDRHQPGVMVWSVGNENMPESKAVADDGWNHLAICEQFVKTLDPTRHTMFPPPGPANKVEGILELRVGDIADIHYSFKLIRKFNKTDKCVNPRDWEGNMESMTRESALKRGWKGVWFSSEYGIFNMIPDLLNAPYLSRISDTEEDILCGKNSLQVFLDRQRREWGYMRDDPTCLGGAFFPWLCSGAGKGTEGNPWGWIRWGEDADWGVVTADLLPKPYFWGLRILFSPVWFPERVTWRKGMKELRFEVTNQYNAIDLKDCTLRTMMTGGGKWMGQMRSYRDVPVSCPPGKTRSVRIPIWNKQTLASLEQGLPAVCRCVLLDPNGFRPVTHDILMVPEKLGGAAATAMPIGPDAVL